MLAIAAVVATALFLSALCRGDPKRRRAARLRGEGNSRALRWTLGIGACLPGIGCLMAGDTAAFLIWVGGAGVAGWLISLLFRPGRGSLAG